MKLNRRHKRRKSNNYTSVAVSVDTRDQSHSKWRKQSKRTHQPGSRSSTPMVIPRLNEGVHSGGIADQDRPAPLYFLPAECWVLEILVKLSGKDLCNVSAVCRYFYVLSTDNYVWRKKYVENWGIASYDYECKALAWLKLKNEDQHGYFCRKEHIFWKQRFGFRARHGDEKIIVRIQYDQGTSFKTLLCTKSDLAGEICKRMANYSTSYRCGSKLYKSLLENGALQYTEELDYLIADHNSFQLFQPIAHGRWLSPVDTLGRYSNGISTPFEPSLSSLARYYDTLNMLELEFKTRIMPVKYSCKVNNVDVTRTILIDSCWDVRQIMHAILTQMHPQIPYAEGAEDYCLVWYPAEANEPRPLSLDLTLHEQGVPIPETTPCAHTLYLVKAGQANREGDGDDEEDEGEEGEEWYRY